MVLNDWIQQLSTIAAVDVRGAADLAGAEDSHQRDTIYVMYAAADAEANRRSQGVLQRVPTEIAVVLAARNRRDGRGQHLVTELESLRDQVRGVLLGWMPPGADGPVVYRRGQLMRLTDAAVWWQETYQAAVWIESNGDIV